MPRKTTQSQNFLGECLDEKRWHVKKFPREEGEGKCTLAKILKPLEYRSPLGLSGANFYWTFI